MMLRRTKISNKLLLKFESRKWSNTRLSSALYQKSRDKVGLKILKSREK